MTETAKQEKKEEVMKDCPFCAEKIKGDAVYCKFCKRDLANPVATQPAVTGKVAPACPLCGGSMRKTTKTQNGMGCLLIIAGILFLPLFGLGLIAIIAGLIIGSKSEGFWTCQKCGHMLPRKRGLLG